MAQKPGAENFRLVVVTPDTPMDLNTLVTEVYNLRLVLEEVV
jgi:hypothetical protein